MRDNPTAARNNPMSANRSPENSIVPTPTRNKAFLVVAIIANLAWMAGLAWMAFFT